MTGGHSPMSPLWLRHWSVLAVVYVLLGRAVTEYRWGGNRNIPLMRHKFLVLTVKKWLKSVYIYGSYRKIKTGVPLFWTTLYISTSVGCRTFPLDIFPPGHLPREFPLRTFPFTFICNNDQRYNTKVNTCMVNKDKCTLPVKIVYWSYLYVEVIFEHTNTFCIKSLRNIFCLFR